jgi:hypothetical protein
MRRQVERRIERDLMDRELRQIRFDRDHAIAWSSSPSSGPFTGTARNMPR